MIVFTILVFGLLSKIYAQDPGKLTYVDVSVPEFKELMENENTVIIDVRTPAEARSGVIEGAQVINIFSTNFKKKVSELPRDKTYLVYCRSGHRSVIACKKMNKLGFKNLYNLMGGYTSWKKN
ncbi:MAG: rhodanese-like domain-containing protein [Chitinophagales bacterium]|nr:rhodanese-like domain-containing protein [Chitinophagales bacterium]